MIGFKDFLLILDENDKHLTFGNTLGSHADVGTNMEDADFWIVRKGTPKKVGSVTNEYSPEHVGVKIRNHTIDPPYMNYALQHLHQKGYYSGLHKGTTNLRNINVSHVKNIPVQPSKFSSMFEWELTEAFNPEIYNSPSGNVISHTYTLPSKKHRIDVLYTQLRAPGDKPTKSYMVDFKRTSLDASGKPVPGTSTFDRRGMSNMDSRDRVHGIMAVRHSLKKFVSTEEPHRISYSANTRKKGAFYKNAFDAHVITSYNKENDYGPEHEHAAKPGYVGTGMVFPKNEPK